MLVLGVDASTQSLTGVIVDGEAARIVWEGVLELDECLPGYGTRRGVLRFADPRVVHGPPLLWVDALDGLLGRLREEGVPLREIRALSVAAQQHGSVYLNDEAEAALAALDPRTPFVHGLRGIFSRATSPIWMDSSTSAECAEIEAALGGAAATAALTGSAAFERFTGPQIRKFFKTDAAGYARTRWVTLISSFLTSLLIGRIAPIDHGDASGTNLMDIRTKTWSARALAATAPDLERRLPPLAPPWTALGPVAAHVAARYGLRRDALVIASTGDNPSSAIGLGLTDGHTAAISLGTSDTFFTALPDCLTDPRGEGHVFASPTGGYLALVCFKNGSLARERVRDAYGLDWPGFIAAIRSRPPGNEGKVLLPYFEPEIVPKVLEPGPRRFDLDPDDAAANCRAVVEAQMLTMRAHSQWMGARPSRIYATGGASQNPEILRIMADVHDCPVHRLVVSNAAALGAALRALHGLRAHHGDAPRWDELVRPFISTAALPTIEPDPSAARIYDELLDRYIECEQQALR